MSRFFYADNSILFDPIELGGPPIRSFQPLEGTLVDE